MVQFRAIDRRTTGSKLINVFRENAEQITKEVYRNTAERLTSFSPVDTGTYVTSHEVASGGRDRAFIGTELARGPRRQEAALMQSAGLSILLGQVEALPPGTEGVMFRNRTAYAGEVEQRYAPYAKTRSEFNNIVADALASLGAGRI